MKNKTFDDLGLEASLTDALREKGITEPFPIQELAIPIALKGADVIGQARTGTGKTLGFGLPVLQRIDPALDRTQALIIVPTRELCLQVTEDLKIGATRGVRVTAIYGGVGYEEQNEALTSGVHIVVGTPGRLLDQMQRGNMDLSGVTELVLDEADEMLDMGFLPDVERLIQGCPSERHSLLFSATMPTAVVKLARRYMTQPTFLRADTEEHEVAPTVEQHFFLVHRMDKPRVLARILQSPGREAVYVFVRTKNMADRLVSELDDLGVDAIAIHGNLRQSTREKNMDTFREGRTNVLVATEVAARGLDVDNVTHVVNYDCPDDHKMYLHRIGRTARAGAKGVAVTFAEFNEVDRLNVIRKAVEAEREVTEVFSTSDELTERFDLPAEAPWDHLAKRSGGGRSSSSSRSKGRDDRGGRKGSSDRKPKSRRSSEGKGSERDADRDRSRSRDRSSDRTPDRSRGSSSNGDRARGSAEERKPAEPTRRDEKAEKVRVRTRSVETSSGDDRRTRARGDEDRSEGGRQRSRARSGGERSRSDDGDTAGSKGSSKGSGRSSGRQRARASSSREDGSGSSKGRSDRDGGSSRRNGGSSKPNGDDGGRRSSRSSERSTHRGEDARGDGQPQLSRRVKVEHLP